MMECLTEQTLHWAARRLVRLGWSSDGPVPDILPAGLRQVLIHCDRCPSCASVLRELRGYEADLEGGEVTGLSLWVGSRAYPLRARRTPPRGYGPLDSDDAEYGVAAQTPQPDPVQGEGVDLRLTLTAEEGRILVRILPNPDGSATAVLVQGGPAVAAGPTDPGIEGISADAGDRKGMPLPPGETAPGERRPRARLVVDGVEYVFGEDRSVRLPEFPAAALGLRVVPPSDEESGGV